MVKRYDMVTEYNKFACEDQVVPVEDNQGEYVKFEDYAELAKRYAEVAAHNAAWAEKCFQLSEFYDTLLEHLLYGEGTSSEVIERLQQEKDNFSVIPNNPTECLREIRAQAGRDGYIVACLSWMGLKNAEGMVFSDADRYADSIRQEKK